MGESPTSHPGASRTFAFGGRYEHSGAIGRWWIASIGSLALLVPSSVFSVWIFLVIPDRPRILGNYRLVVVFLLILIVTVLALSLLRAARVRSRAFFASVVMGSATLGGCFALATFAAYGAPKQRLGLSETLQALVPYALDPLSVAKYVADSYSTTGSAIVAKAAAIACFAGVFICGNYILRYSLGARYYNEALDCWFGKSRSIGRFEVPFDSGGTKLSDKKAYAKTFGRKNRPALVTTVKTAQADAWIEYRYFPTEALAELPVVGPDSRPTGETRTDFVLVEEVFVERKSRKLLFSRVHQTVRVASVGTAFFVERAFVDQLVAQLKAAGAPARGLELPTP